MISSMKSNGTSPINSKPGNPLSGHANERINPPEQARMRMKILLLFSINLFKNKV
jgi:hypothetical protein